MTMRPTPRPTEVIVDHGPGEDAAGHVPKLSLCYCDEWIKIDGAEPFGIGRDSDLDIDDNPYLHRTFLVLRWDRYWWLENVGNSLAATISDGGGMTQSWIAPGAVFPLVFAVTEVRFTAGPTNYEFSLHLDDAVITASGTVVSGSGLTTLRPMTLTLNQKQLVVSLAEPALLRHGNVASRIPSSAEASARLRWTITKFNRQLDAVCQKLDKAGVRGLYGTSERLASGRRARLVEYALAVRLISAEDLPLLDKSLDEDPE